MSIWVYDLKYQYSTVHTGTLDPDKTGLKCHYSATHNNSGPQNVSSLQGTR